MDETDETHTVQLFFMFQTFIRDTFNNTSIIVRKTN